MSGEYIFKVRFGDTDAAGIVFYPNFYKWMDEATHEFISNSGIKSERLFKEMNINVPLLEAKCKFIKPLFFEDIVTIKSEITELHKKVLKITHLFYRNNECIAEGYEVRAWTSFQEKPKAVEIPEEIRQKMIAKNTLIVQKQ